MSWNNEVKHFSILLHSGCFDLTWFSILVDIMLCFGSTIIVDVTQFRMQRTLRNCEQSGFHLYLYLQGIGWQGSTNDAPENVRPISPSTLNRDTSQGPTSMDTSHRSFTSPPSEPPPRHSYSKSSEDMNLPSAPSNPIPPSYGQNPYASTDSTGYPSSAPPPSHQPSLYPHNSGTPFDSLGGGGNDKATPTIGTYS